MVHSQSHPGQLYRKLFLDGKNTNYDRQACVAFPDDQRLRRVIDINDLYCQTELESLSTLGASTKEYKSAKTAVKASFKAKITEVTKDVRTRPGKYALTGTLSTNGLDLKVHAHNMSKPRKSTIDATEKKKTTQIQVAKNNLPYLASEIPGPAAYEKTLAPKATMSFWEWTQE